MGVFLVPVDGGDDTAFGLLTTNDLEEMTCVVNRLGKPRGRLWRMQPYPRMFLTQRHYCILRDRIGVEVINQHQWEQLKLVWTIARRTNRRCSRIRWSTERQAAPYC